MELFLFNQLAKHLLNHKIEIILMFNFILIIL